MVKKLLGMIVTLLNIQKESTLHMVLCQRRSMWTLAKVIVVAMRMKRLTPDVFSFRAAISACEKGG
eukprot:6421792-Karenia_brevis.AAC.1